MLQIARSPITGHSHQLSQDVRCPFCGSVVPRHPQIVWRHQRPRRRQLRRRRGRGARACRRERRRQVHAAEDPCRPGAPRRRRDPLARPAARPHSPREAIEHGIGMVYQEMLSFPESQRLRQHLRRPRALLARPAPRSRDARAHPASCSIGCICRSIPTRPPNRSRPRIGSCSRSRGRWRSIAGFWCSTSRRPRSPTPKPITCSTCCASCSTAARRSSTCRIGCRKCSGCAIASPCCATARLATTVDRDAVQHR